MYYYPVVTALFDYRTLSVHGLSRPESDYGCRHGLLNVLNDGICPILASDQPIDFSPISRSSRLYPQLGTSFLEDPLEDKVEVFKEIKDMAHSSEEATKDSEAKIEEPRPEHHLFQPEVPSPLPVTEVKQPTEFEDHLKADEEEKEEEEEIPPYSPPDDRHYDDYGHPPYRRPYPPQWQEHETPDYPPYPYGRPEYPDGYQVPGENRPPWQRGHHEGSLHQMQYPEPIMRIEPEGPAPLSSERLPNREVNRLEQQDDDNDASQLKRDQENSKALKDELLEIMKIQNAAKSQPEEIAQAAGVSPHDVQNVALEAQMNETIVQAELAAVKANELQAMENAKLRRDLAAAGIDLDEPHLLPVRPNAHPSNHETAQLSELHQKIVAAIEKLSAPNPQPMPKPVEVHIHPPIREDVTTRPVLQPQQTEPTIQFPPMTSQQTQKLSEAIQLGRQIQALGPGAKVEVQHK